MYHRPGLSAAALGAAEEGASGVQVDEDLWTPLHGAACFGEVGVVRQLVEHGANIFAANAENDIPLDIAVDDKTREYLSGRPP